MNKTISTLRKKKRHQKKIGQSFPDNTTKSKARKIIMNRGWQTPPSLGEVRSLEDRSQKMASMGLDDKVTAL